MKNKLIILLLTVIIAGCMSAATKQFLSVTYYDQLEAGKMEQSGDLVGAEKKYIELIEYIELTHKNDPKVPKKYSATAMIPARALANNYILQEKWPEAVKTYESVMAMFKTPNGDLYRLLTVKYLYSKSKMESYDNRANNWLSNVVKASPPSRFENNDLDYAIEVFHVYGKRLNRQDFVNYANNINPY